MLHAAEGRRRRFDRDRRILLRRDFDAVFERPNTRLSVPPLWLVARPGPADAPRLGLIVGKKVLRRAVDRNRAKRVIREVFRLADGLPPLDIVVRVVEPGGVACLDADRLFQALRVRIAKTQRRERRRRVL